MNLITEFSFTKKLAIELSLQRINSFIQTPAVSRLLLIIAVTIALIVSLTYKAEFSLNDVRHEGGSLLITYLIQIPIFTVFFYYINKKVYNQLLIGFTKYRLDNLPQIFWGDVSIVRDGNKLYIKSATYQLVLDNRDVFKVNQINEAIFILDIDNRFVFAVPLIVKDVDLLPSIKSWSK